MTINHGIPDHPYFIIAQPPSVAKPTVDMLSADYVKPVFELKDPKTNTVVKAELQDVWVMKVTNVQGCNSFCLLAYGIEAKKLIGVLMKRFPEIEQKQKIHFLLLKKL